MLTKFIVLIAALASLAVALPQSRARQIFACDDLLNEAIARELEVSQFYLSASNYFANDLVALHGFAKHFKDDWKEEIEHAEKLTDFGIKRGANIKTSSIPKTDDNQWENLSVCEIVNKTLDYEKFINQKLHELHECATEKPNYDPEFQGFLEVEFIEHHFEVNKKWADLLTILERATKVYLADGSSKSTCDGLGLYLIDRKLEKIMADKKKAH